MNGWPISAARRTSALMICALVAFAGCASWQTPRIDPSGERIFLPAEATVIPCPPILPGIPAPQEGLHLSPGEIIAPVGSEVIMLAGVTRADGSLWPHQRVEWMLDEQGVGQFVTLGDRDHWHPLRLPRDTPRKVTNHFAVGNTSHSLYTITRGTIDPSDDVTVQQGQAWISVTSATEGVSKVTAYSPSVPNWDLRRTTGTIHWVDAQWVFPPPAINPVGTSHVFTTTVSRHTNSTPLPGWIVRYEIIGGPPAGFAPNDSQVIDVPTDQLGQASVEIVQTQPVAGTSRIGIQIIRPPMSGLERELILGTGTVTKTWTSPDIGLHVTGPAQASVGATATYQFQATNPGDLPTRGVTMTSELPAGTSLVGTNPQAEMSGGQLTWNLGDLAPRETRVVELHLRADQPGQLNVCGSVRTGEGLTANSCATTAVSTPNLDIRVTGPQTAVVGSNVRYEVTVTNLGQVAATGLIITDRFGAGFEHMAARSPIERDLEDIEPGQARTIYITFRVVQPGEHCHTVEVTGAGGLQASAQACLTATPAPEPSVMQPPVTQPPVTEPPVTQPPVTEQPPVEQPPAQPAGEAAIAVTKTGPQQLRVGQVAEFFIEVRNTGEVPLTNVRIVDTYDLALDPVNATGGFTVGREELIWQLPSLAPGATHRLQVNCQCLTPAGQACNRVTVTSDQRPPVAHQACLEIFPQEVSPSDLPPAAAGMPNLSVSVADLNDPVQVGQETTYRIFVTNQGTTPVRNMQLSVTLPVELTPLPDGTTGPVRAGFAGQTIRFEPVAEMRPETELRPADSLSFTVRARAARAGTARVLAEVVAEGLAPIQVGEETQILGGP